MRMVVDLPAPLGPRKPVTVPGFTTKSSPSTAVFSPYFLVSCRASIIRVLSVWLRRPALRRRTGNARCRNTPNRWYRKADLRRPRGRSEEHTSELQSRRDLVCRLLLEKKKY